MRRPPTPKHLRRFVMELYDGRCLRCGVDRPLAVSHLADWPTVREDVMKTPGEDGLAFWRFHQPENVVLLCCNCHALLDNPKVPEVDQALMFYLRDRAMANPHFGEVVRKFLCQELGPVQRRNVNINGLKPLFQWLHKAVRHGTLPPPHRFLVPWGTVFGLVDLTEGTYTVPEEDPSLPYWDGQRFVFPAAS